MKDIKDDCNVEAFVLTDRQTEQGHTHHAPHVNRESREALGPAATLELQGPDHGL